MMGKGGELSIQLQYLVARHQRPRRRQQGRSDSRPHRNLRSDRPDQTW
jgi:hypothetical protein